MQHEADPNRHAISEVRQAAALLAAERAVGARLEASRLLGRTWGKGQRGKGEGKPMEGTRDDFPEQVGRHCASDPP